MQKNLPEILVSAVLTAVFGPTKTRFHPEVFGSPPHDVSVLLSGHRCPRRNGRFEVGMLPIPP